LPEKQQTALVLCGGPRDVESDLKQERRMNRSVERTSA
jgi:hypothetical protein